MRDARSFDRDEYNEYGGTRSESTLTTPDPPQLHELFARYAAEGAEYVVMELSAHAIYYRKLAECAPKRRCH